MPLIRRGPRMMTDVLGSELERRLLGYVVLPCPFCGGALPDFDHREAHRLEPNIVGEYCRKPFNIVGARCESCGCKGPDVEVPVSRAEGEVLATAAWNRRKDRTK